MEIKTRRVVCDVCDCSETFDLNDPNNHGWIRFTNIRQDEIKNLCPVCSEKLRKIIDKFFNEDEGE